ncbi:MAG: CBS domain-containing protein [Solobacterium sp.]|nr:CBS domain-containing protein [Solobacterium sp.]
MSAHDGNAERFLKAYATIEYNLNRMLCKNDYTPFKKLVQMASRHNAVIAKNEEILKEYSDLRNAIVHQIARTEEVIAEPVDSVTEDIERIASLLNEDENVAAYATTPVMIADETTTVKEAWALLRQVNGDKLPVYERDRFLGIVTMSEIAGWMIEGKSADDVVRKLIVSDEPHTKFMCRRASIMDAVLFFDEYMQGSKVSPVILVTENGDATEKPIGILSSHDLSRILAALI